MFFIDMGVEGSTRPADNMIPPIITAVREASDTIRSAKHFCGVFICGSGVGVSIAANRHKGIRAALCHTIEEVRSAREHNDANVLCLSADNIGADCVKKMITVFLNTKFLNEIRYQKRRELFDTLS